MAEQMKEGVCRKSKALNGKDIRLSPFVVRTGGKDVGKVGKGAIWDRKDINFPQEPYKCSRFSFNTDMPSLESAI